MSLVPLLLNEMLDDQSHDNHLFGLGLIDNLFHPVQNALLHVPLKSGYMHPWRHVRAKDSGVSSLVNDKNDFKVNLDVQQFKPEELKVTIDDGYLIVNGQHEERQDDHGYISRQFCRKYKIPDDVDQAALVSKLTSDGVLSLHAPKKIKTDDKKVIELPITRTNQPMKIQDKENVPKGDCGEKKIETH